MAEIKPGDTGYLTKGEQRLDIKRVERSMNKTIITTETTVRYSTGWESAGWTVHITPTPLPAEPGWYESEHHPLFEGADPYVLRDGEWFLPNDDMNPLATDYIRTLMPLHRLVRERT